MSRILGFGLFFAIHTVLGIHLAYAATLPANAVTRLSAGEAVDLIIEYDGSAVSQEAATLRRSLNKQTDDDEVQAYKVNRYRGIKQDVDRDEESDEIDDVEDYSHLPLRHKRFRSLSALQAFATNPGVAAIYEDIVLHTQLTESLALINQPAVAGVGDTGSGTTVAVIDNGIDYTRAAFGSCSSPGVPAGCHVVVSQDFGSGTTDTNHGTNVSAIVLGVAPGTQVAMLNVFSGTSAFSSAIISAINWSVANKSSYNIVAINMSLGDGSRNTSQCSSGNVFYPAINSAKSAGIAVVAAAGNEGYADGLAKPACTPGVISVGAVYDSNIGGVNWGVCSDATTGVDKITCFSDSASFLTLLAPGSIITAAGILESGTSQAAPHVAGAIAVLRAAFPGETTTQIQARLTNTGVQITDPRNGIVKPRLNLLEAARPVNDQFSGRVAISGSSGTSGGISNLASKEADEPNHAGNAGGASIWWKWTAPSSGQVSIDTHGSDYDTLLAAYVGNGVAVLTPKASNDDDGSSGGVSSLLFQAQAGTEYQIAVDGKSGVSGNAVVHWGINSTASSNLSVSLSGPGSGADGSQAQYTITAANAGPQTATNVVVTLDIPAGASFVSGPTGCSVVGTTVVCNLGNLGSGANAGLLVTLQWDTANGTTTISASVSSDVPDAITTNNNGTLVVIVDAGDGDAPTLPEWGLILLAIWLMGISMQAHRSSQLQWRRR